MYIVRNITEPQAVQVCTAYSVSMLIRFRICSWRSSPQPCFLTTSSICCGCVMRGEHGLDTYVACRTMQCSHGRQEDSWSSQLCLMMQAAAAWTHCSSMGLPSSWDSTSAYGHKDFYRGSTHPIRPANCRLSSIAALREATPLTLTELSAYMTGQE